MKERKIIVGWKSYFEELEEKTKWIMETLKKFGFSVSTELDVIDTYMCLGHFKSYDTLWYKDYLSGDTYTWQDGINIIKDLVHCNDKEAFVIFGNYEVFDPSSLYYLVKKRFCKEP